MSWTLFIGGIMAGMAAVWGIVEKAKYDMAEAEYEAHVREINVPELQEVQVVNCMTAEEFNERMDELFKIFA